MNTFFGLLKSVSYIRRAGWDGRENWQNNRAARVSCSRDQIPPLHPPYSDPAGKRLRIDSAGSGRDDTSVYWGSAG